MSDYEKWKANQNGRIWHTHCCSIAFDGGVESKQAEIDTLNSKIEHLKAKLVAMEVGSQLKIDELERWNKNQYELIKRNESHTQTLKHLLQKLIDDGYTTMRPSMAYEIQEAMRGEHESP